MKAKICLAALLAALMMSGCSTFQLSIGNRVVGSGSVTTEERAVSGFDAISLAGSGDVVITYGDRESLSIEADDNLLPYITSEVRGGTLVLGVQRNTNIQSRNPIVYKVTMKALTELELAGSGSIVSPALETDTLEITLAGSGDIRVEGLSAQVVSTNLTGSGNVRLDGTVGQEKVTISGSGTYQAEDLRAAEAEARLVGSGDVTVWATETLDASIPGSGTIAYYGDPQVNSRVQGSGSVRDLGAK